MRACFSLLLFLGASVCVSAGVSACATAPPASLTAEPKMLPAEQAPVPLEGGVQLHELVRGHVAIVDLWASWCTACVETMPKLMRLEASYRERGLIVAGVSVGESAEKASGFAKGVGVNYPLYVDPEFAFADRLVAREVPTLLVIDRAGNIVLRTRTLDRSVLDLLRFLLGTQTSSAAPSADATHEPISEPSNGPIDEPIN